MFQPFEQLDGGARVGGTGLRLAISLASARLMGGDISVESTLPARGSKRESNTRVPRSSADRGESGSA